MTAPAQAAQLAVGVGTSLAYESNVQRVEVNPQADLIQSLYGGFLLSENTDQVKGQAVAQVERRHFYNNTFSDDSTIFVDGSGVWNILPRRLSWLVEDTYREVQLDITAPDTPSNRTQSNSLNTGPDLTIPFSSSNSVLLSGRYGRFDIKNSLNDNQRLSGAVRGIHALSPASSISVNYEAARVQFEPEAQAYPKILQQNLYGRFQTLSAGNGAAIDVGQSRVTRYTAEDLQGRMVRVALSREFTRGATVRMSYADQISDTYTDQIRGITNSGAPTDQGVVIAQGINFGTGDIYHSRRGDLFYGGRAGALDYGLQGYGRTVDFLTLNDDYNEYGGRAAVSWAPGTARLYGYADGGKRTFVTLDRVDVVRNFGVNLDYRLNRNVTFTVQASVAQQFSSAPANTFTDQRVMVAVSYSTGQQYQVQSRR